MKLSEFKKTFRVGGSEPTIHSHNIFKGAEALWEVGKRPCNLQFVLSKDQTVEICLAAMEKNVFFYKYVNKDVFEPEEDDDE